MDTGKIWLDHSTTDHEQNKVFTEQLGSRGALLECPITGGLEALKKGQMAVWVGGEERAYQEVKVIIDGTCYHVTLLQFNHVNIFFAFTI